jgi:hypothetical protein
MPESPGLMNAARRSRLFLLITVLTPLLLLGGAELVLRAMGVGQLEPLFVPVESAPGYLQPNPAAVQRFFPDPRDAPDVSIDTTWFPATKAAGTLRIFVQGESTAAGFPYGRIRRPRQQRRGGRIPIAVEVIKRDGGGHQLRAADFADEIIAQHPDAVVTTQGTTSTSARRRRLRRSSARSRRRQPPPAARCADCTSTALERARLPGGPILFPSAPDGLARQAHRSFPYERGLEQFRDNLDRLLRKYRDAGVPVFIGTLASNERDQPPFASAPVEQGEASALAHFEKARGLEAEGDLAKAREEYLAAKDRDELRFRAPESFNALIRELAETDGAHLVDVQGAMAAASRDGIIGSN